MYLFFGGRECSEPFESGMFDHISELRIKNRSESDLRSGEVT